MNVSQSPSFSEPRGRWSIADAYEDAARAAYRRGDLTEGDRFRLLYQRTAYQIRLTLIANRYPRR